MSLAVKEILNIGCRQLEECGIADAAIDCKLLYCHLMNITTTQDGDGSTEHATEKDDDAPVNAAAAQSGTDAGEQHK